MISESASEPSSMSPSPPATKLSKHNHKVKSPKPTNLVGTLKDERQSKIKLEHSTTTTTHSNAKKKSKPIHDDVNDNDDDEDDNDDSDNDNGHPVTTKKRKLTNSVSDSHSHSKANKNHKHESKHQNQKAANDVGQAISHKNKCPEAGTISTCIPSSVKRLKKEKKRYQELVIDGFTITAFRTWEDLQDEINERISDSIKRSSQFDDSEMPNTSNSTTSSLTATAINSHPNQTNTTNTTSRTPPPQFKQLPSSSGLSSSSNTASEIYGNPISHHNPHNHPHHHHNHHRSDRQDHLNQIGASSMLDNHGNSRTHNHIDLRMDYTDQQSLLPKTLRPTNDHERRQVNHDNSNRRDKYHKSGMQSTLKKEEEETQHQSSSTVNSNHFSSNERVREQNRSSQPNEIDPRCPTKTQFDPFRAAPPPFPPASVNAYSRRSPSPPRGPPLPSSQAAQQYFQQYHQLYQQMHNSNHQPPPHPQNPYLALINQSHGAHFKAPPHPAQTQQPPPPPPPAMPMPGPSSMMASSHFNSPYTITDTIISRQTSIIPSSPMPPMPGSLEHLAGGRYGRNPHFSALEHHHLMPPSFGQYHQPGGYMPSPTERSFMELARSYANASNMSSSYANFINQASMPKNPVGIPNLYDRMTMDQQHRAMIQSFGPGGSNPFPSFNPVGRPPTISMFPPQFFP